MEIQGKVPYKVVPKSWGEERWIYNGDYCGKLLIINQGSQCSWHYHKLKEETFYLQSGECQVTYSWDDDKGKAQIVILKPGECFHVPTGLRHQMYALQYCELLEFSTHHEDNDSIRVSF
jgi:mannose-6-phosphate isomerase-like protein (cupin superfamily)